MKTSRRHFLKTTTATSLAGFLPIAKGKESAHVPFGKVEHCVMIWLGGGMAQIDTFDPKAKGDAKGKKAGAYYDAIDTAVPGVKVCQHLPGLAKRMEWITAVRTVHHDVIDEHAAATNRMHTGRRVNGSLVYPSLGSIVAQQRGAAGDDAPPYVVIGYPNPVRGPGFLGAKHSYLYLLDTESGPSGLARPDHVTGSRLARREDLLSVLRTSARETRPDDILLANYDEAMEQSMRLSTGRFMDSFQLDKEPGALRESYGSEFGQRLLLSRRLIQRGVRFLEVSQNLNFMNGTGWDTHNDGQLNQHLLIQDLDKAVSAFLDDLKGNGLLDKTLVVINTEFGRPGQFDSGGGRGHHGKAFSLVLAGGGLNHCGAYGVTNEIAEVALENPVGVPDFFATICAAMAIDPGAMLQGGERPVPITDMGQPIGRLLT
jgi:hypothetical protein